MLTAMPFLIKRQEAGSPTMQMPCNIFGLLTDADIDWMARVGFRRRLKDGGAADGSVLCRP
jgi:hypothetical protein